MQTAVIPRYITAFISMVRLYLFCLLLFYDTFTCEDEGLLRSSVIYEFISFKSVTQKCFRPIRRSGRFETVRSFILIFPLTRFTAVFLWKRFRNTWWWWNSGQSQCLCCSSAFTSVSFHALLIFPSRCLHVELCVAVLNSHLRCLPPMKAFHKALTECFLFILIFFFYQIKCLCPGGFLCFNICHPNKPPVRQQVEAAAHYWQGIDI